jgi:hypothetical protein
VGVIQVVPGRLQAAGGSLIASGSSIGAVRGELGATVGAAGAMGDSNAAASFVGMCDAWATALSLVDGFVRGLGATTQAAGSAYQQTDAHYGGVP